MVLFYSVFIQSYVYCCVRLCCLFFGDYGSLDFDYYNYFIVLKNVRFFDEWNIIYFIIIVGFRQIYFIV